MALLRYTIQQGDTIHQVARQLLGQADQWWVLARFNRLDYPYVDTSGVPYPGMRVLGLGDVLLVPTDVESETIKRAALTLDADPYRVVCGVDLRLTDLGDLLANVGTADWSVAEGIDNLVQALQRRLLTRKGELAYHPEYGSYLEQHVGQPLDEERAQLVRLEVLSALMADPRIKAVERVDFLAADDHLDIVVDVQIIGMDDVVPLNLVVPRAGG
jgi:phage baseplate assembly protein W